MKKNDPVGKVVFVTKITKKVGRDAANGRFVSKSGSLGFVKSLAMDETLMASPTPLSALPKRPPAKSALPKKTDK